MKKLTLKELNLESGKILSRDNLRTFFRTVCMQAREADAVAPEVAKVEANLA